MVKKKSLAYKSKSVHEKEPNTWVPSESEDEADTDDEKEKREVQKSKVASSSVKEN